MSIAKTIAPRGRLVTGLALGLLAASLLPMAGCGGSGGDYRSQRPPLDELDPRDRGLQSKDVLLASDLADDLLALPELNASPVQWRVVVMPVKDYTSGRQFVNYDTFIERLRIKVQEEGRGRVRISRNRDKLYETRERELDDPYNEGDDEFGQGGGRRATTRRQPDFALEGEARDLPNRGTTYHQIRFVLVDLESGDEVWSKAYEVRTGR